METLSALRKETNNSDGIIYTPDQVAAAGEGTNWQNEIFRNGAPVQSYQLSVAGGGDRNDYYFGLNYFDQKGIVKCSDLKKYNIRANLN